MTPVLVGQLLGVSFACGLNLYATVATLGLLSRTGLIGSLPPGLRGLESAIVIGTALTLYLIEAIVDRVHHADSVWDTVHTFIRPPAAALLALGALWGQPASVQVAAAAFAFVVALAAHATKAGFRVALNATDRNRGASWISTLEDVAAVAFVVAAFEFPATALAAGAAVLAMVVVVGPRLWRAFALGIRCLNAWVRTLFTPAGWRTADQIPRRLRNLLDDVPMGTAPPRGARAAIRDFPGVGAYRNGWLAVTGRGPVFLFGGIMRPRRVDLPTPERIETEHGLWLHTVRIGSGDIDFTIYLLKDGPRPELAVAELEAVTL
jgi:hypothetical protein